MLPARRFAPSKRTAGASRIDQPAEFDGRQPRRVVSGRRAAGGPESRAASARDNQRRYADRPSPLPHFVRSRPALWSLLSNSVRIFVRPFAAGFKAQHQGGLSVHAHQPPSVVEFDPYAIDTDYRIALAKILRTPHHSNLRSSGQSSRISGVKVLGGRSARIAASPRRSLLTISSSERRRKSHRRSRSSDRQRTWSAHLPASGMLSLSLLS